MIFYINLVFIVIAVSLDGFGVGMTYGMRNIRITLLALCIIMICSGLIVFASMMVGNVLQLLLSPVITEILGGIILIALGIFVFFSIIRSKASSTATTESKLDLTPVEKNPFNRLKSVISDPRHADIDKSGSISVGEALFLGTALALDAFGAGLGASMLGYSPIVTPFLVATMSGAFVFSGIKIGLMLSKSKWMTKLTYFPPTLLICIGLYNVWA